MAEVKSLPNLGLFLSRTEFHLLSSSSGSHFYFSYGYFSYCNPFIYLLFSLHTFLPLLLQFSLLPNLGLFLSRTEFHLLSSSSGSHCIISYYTFLIAISPIFTLLISPIFTSDKSRPLFVSHRIPFMFPFSSNLTLRSHCSTSCFYFSYFHF